MIKLEQVVEILKKDNNFREISSAGEYYFNWPKEVNFDQLSYDSRKSTKDTLFFAKGLNFKKEYNKKDVRIKNKLEELITSCSIKER